MFRFSQCLAQEQREHSNPMTFYLAKTFNVLCVCSVTPGRPVTDSSPASPSPKAQYVCRIPRLTVLESPVQLTVSVYTGIHLGASGKACGWRAGEGLWVACHSGLIRLCFPPSPCCWHLTCQCDAALSAWSSWSNQGSSCHCFLCHSRQTN